MKRESVAFEAVPTVVVEHGGHAGGEQGFCRQFKPAEIAGTIEKHRQFVSIEFIDIARLEDFGDCEINIRAIIG